MIPIFRSSNWAIVTSDVGFPAEFMLMHHGVPFVTICHNSLAKSGIFGPNKVLLNEATSHGQQWIHRWLRPHFMLWTFNTLNLWAYILISSPIWVFPKIVVPQNGWFIMENPIKHIKIDDLGVPLFSETPICLEFPWAWADPGFGRSDFRRCPGTGRTTTPVWRSGHRVASTMGYLNHWCWGLRVVVSPCWHILNTSW